MYRKAKRDDNERELITFMERCGCVVQQLDDPGVPDLLVAAPWNVNLLMEVKNKNGSLTPAQKDFFSTWIGQACVVRNIKDVKETLRKSMPVYVYQCEECKHTWQKRQSFNDPPEVECPSCGKLRGIRVPQPVGVIFRGNGWYAKDSKSSGS